MNDVTVVGATVRLKRESGQILTGSPEFIVRHINRNRIKVNDPKCLPVPYREMIHPDLIVKPIAP